MLRVDFARVQKNQTLARNLHKSHFSGESSALLCHVVDKTKELLLLIRKFLLCDEEIPTFLSVRCDAGRAAGGDLCAVLFSNAESHRRSKPQWPALFRTIESTMARFLGHY